MCLAGLINALKIAEKDISAVKVVLNGAGAAGIACVRLMCSYGVRKENVIMCDTKGVIFKGRTEGMSAQKEEFANDTPKRTLAEALEGADVFVGVSAAGALKPEYLVSMGPMPIIFAMANPEPEIRPSVAKQVRADAIVATGRSDYPNQINNVMCFPFLFRGTLDTRSRIINEDMKMAAALALSELARLPVPEEVLRAYEGRQFTFGPDYIIPTPFDPRLIFVVSEAVAKAAIKSGVAQNVIEDWVDYQCQLRARTTKPNL